MYCHTDQQQVLMKWRPFSPICISPSTELHKGALVPFTAFSRYLPFRSMSASRTSFYSFVLTGTSVPVPCPTSLQRPYDHKLHLSSYDKPVLSSGAVRHLLTSLQDLHASVGWCRPGPSLCRSKRLKQLLQVCAWLSLGWGAPIVVLDRTQGSSIFLLSLAAETNVLGPFSLLNPSLCRSCYQCS